MTPADIKEQLKKIPLSQKLFPSEFIQSLKAFYAHCKKINANTYRELTVEEYHLFFTSCLWNQKPQSVFDISLYEPLENAACKALGYMPYMINNATLRIIVNHQSLSLGITQWLLTNAEDKELDLVRLVFTKLSLRLWSLENFTKAKSNYLMFVHINRISQMIKTSISKQTTFDLLIEHGQELSLLLSALNTKFLLDTKISENDLLRLKENAWLFANSQVMQALDKHRFTIAVDVVGLKDPLSFIIDKALKIAQELHIDPLRKNLERGAQVVSGASYCTLIPALQNSKASQAAMLERPKSPSGLANAAHSSYAPLFQGAAVSKTAESGESPGLKLSA